MKISRFSVVELKDNKKATILDIKDNEYFVEVVDENGKSLGNKSITDNEIERIIFQKKKLK